MTEDDDTPLWGDPTRDEIEAMKLRLREAHYAARRGDEVPEDLRRVVRSHEYYGNQRKPRRPSRARFP